MSTLSPTMDRSQIGNIQDLDLAITLAEYIGDL